MIKYRKKSTFWNFPNRKKTYLTVEKYLLIEFLQTKKSF